MGTPAQQRWITKLLGYAFILEYKQGKENVVADALSRRSDDEFAASVQSDLSISVPSVSAISGVPPASEGTLCIISFPTPSWLFDLKLSYASDPKILSIMQAIWSGSNAYPGFTFCNGLLFYKGKLFLGESNGDLKSVVL